MSLDDVRRAISLAGIMVFISRQEAKEKARLCADVARAKARWVWHHRTKTAGGLAMAAGSLQGFIESHAGLAKYLPGSQAMLILFGGVVTAIGGYNTLARIFGWEDDPTP